MDTHVLVAGGGIGGMAAALACSLAGQKVSLFERASTFSEVGAGIQIGPNVVRQLHQWGLDEALRGVVAFPHRLQARDAHDGAELGVLPLGQAMQQRYGAPYATVHRADLHTLLQVALASDSVLAAPRDAVASALDAGQLVALHVAGVPPLFSEMGVVTLRGRSPSPMADLLMRRLPGLSAQA